MRSVILQTLTTAVIFLACSGTVSAGATSPDAVGVMVSLETGSYSLVQDKLYQFNTGSGATYFSNHFTGQVDCVTETGAWCDPTSAPTVPAVDSAMALQAAESQACVFLSGGTLASSTYTKKVRVATRRSIRTYTYQYVITPTGPVEQLSSWDFVEDQPNSNGIARIRITGEIANQQVRIVRKAKSYSFPMVVGGDQLLTKLAVSINGAPVQAWIENVQNCAGCQPGQPYALDFAFGEVTASSGNAALLQTGDARTILNTDADPNNDNGGAGGTLLQETILKPDAIALPPGDHTLTVSGTSAGVGFSVSKTLRVMTQSCSVSR